MNRPATRSVLELERALRAPDHVTGPDLVAIRASGRRRRRFRRVAVGSTSLAVLGVVAGLTWTVASGDGGSGDEVAVDLPPAPTELSPLAKRALKEVPGATKVSAYQVVLPDPGVPVGPVGLEPADVVSQVSELPAHTYAGVTLFPEGTFPPWLHDGVDRAEAAMAGPDGSRAVGSFAQGIIVDTGPASLGCTTWNESPGCAVSLLSSDGGDYYTEWSMGTEDFLDEGARMEVFSSENFSTGRATTFWIAGIDGGVASADFVQTDGTVVTGTVAYGRVTEGDSMMWADLSGDLAKVVAYDADGEVIEDHELLPCDSPVECEVR